MSIFKKAWRGIKQAVNWVGGQDVSVSSDINPTLKDYDDGYGGGYSGVGSEMDPNSPQYLSNTWDSIRGLYTYYNLPDLSQVFSSPAKSDSDPYGLEKYSGILKVVAGVVVFIVVIKMIFK